MSVQTAEPAAAAAPPAAAPASPGVPATGPAASVTTPALAPTEGHLHHLAAFVERFLPHLAGQTAPLADPAAASAALAELRQEYRAHAKDVFYVAHLALAVAQAVPAKEKPVVGDLEKVALEVVQSAASLGTKLLTIA